MNGGPEGGMLAPVESGQLGIYFSDSAERSQTFACSNALRFQRVLILSRTVEAAAGIKVIGENGGGPRSRG